MGRSAWPMRAIKDALEALAPGLALQVEVVDSIDSTNSELMRRARDGQRQAVLLVAQRQTAGRGRMGRTWYSEQAHAPTAERPLAADRAFASLTFSLGMPLAPQDWSGLSLAVGVSLALSLHPALMLKWPNDLWLHERKLAGILIETAGATEARRFAVVGVGINIAPHDAVGLSTPAASLQELAPELDAPAALARIAPALLQSLLVFEAHGFAAFEAAFRARDALLGRAVELSDGGTGVARGVDRSGALLVHTASGMKTVSSAEVSVRALGAGAGGH